MQQSLKRIWKKHLLQVIPQIFLWELYVAHININFLNKSAAYPYESKMTLLEAKPDCIILLYYW